MSRSKHLSWFICHICTVFLAIMTWGGCVIQNGSWSEHGPCDAVDGSVGPNNLSDVEPIQDRMLDGAVSLPNDASIMSTDLDAGPVNATDSGSSMDADAIPSDSTVVMLANSGAAIVSASTCQNTNLNSLPPGFLRTGFTFWHICYRTPSAMTSMNPLANERSQGVMVLRRDDDMSPPHELIHVLPPRTANPWSVSVVVAVPDPPSGTAFLNLRNEYANSQSLYAVDQSSDGNLVTNGEIRLWQVTLDHHQLPTTFHLLPGGFMPN